MFDLNPIIKFFSEFLFFTFVPLPFPSYYFWGPVLYIVLYFIFAKKLSNRKNFPHKDFAVQLPQLRRELFYSFITQFVFFASSLFLNNYIKIGFFGWNTDFTAKFNYDFNLWTIPYIIASAAFVYVAHGTWFYWTHRAMHHPKIFKHVHKVHHLSRDITPMSAVAFHPIEAFINGFYGFFLITALPLPLHPIGFLVYGVIESWLTVYVHSGYELYPAGFTRHWFWKHFPTSTHHNMHHEKIGGNYGINITFWDRIMGTEFKDYHDRFDSLTKGKKDVV
jgi:Delta7-sterol 5-desaturase